MIKTVAFCGCSNKYSNPSFLPYLHLTIHDNVLGSAFPTSSVASPFVSTSMSSPFASDNSFANAFGTPASNQGEPSLLHSLTWHLNCHPCSLSDIPHGEWQWCASVSISQQAGHRRPGLQPRQPGQQPELCSRKQQVCDVINTVSFSSCAIAGNSLMEQQEVPQWLTHQDLIHSLNNKW